MVQTKIEELIFQTSTFQCFKLIKSGRGDIIKLDQSVCV